MISFRWLPPKSLKLKTKNAGESSIGAQFAGAGRLIAQTITIAKMTT
jgi:hypothetical protein